MEYRRRLDNFRIFRHRLATPLVAVELSFGEKFHLTDADADLLIQLRGHDVMFQKERLLNLAVAALPPECEALIWLDCDLVFEDQSWPQRTLDQLQSNRLVQAFDTFHELPRDVDPADLFAAQPTATRRAWAAELRRGALPEDILAVDFRLQGLTSGGAMACRRELIADLGIYDACVMGSGVRALTAAAVGRPQDAARYIRFNPAWEQHYASWATRFHERVGGRIGSTPGAVRHLWHGRLSDRRYGPRHDGFAQFGFDPFADLQFDSSGCFAWASDKPEMHRYVEDYFRARREDG
jgi:hypothetical protein